MKKITLPLVMACCVQLANAQCGENFTVPYTAATESVTVPALPDCMDSQWVAFASQEVFKSIAGPVAGFDGKLLAYDTYTGNPGGGAMIPTIGAELFTHEIYFQQGVQYTVSYRYGNSDAAKSIGRFGVQLNQPGTTYYDDLATHLNVTGATAANHTTAAFTVPASGNYYIKFDVQSFENEGLFYLDAISVQALTMGTGENLLTQHLSVYPNPTSGRLKVIGQNTIDRLDIYSLSGQLLRTETPNTLSHEADISSLATGMYIVQVQSGSRVEKIKICKQ
ncbi:T9SS type A sorting domain-containing protein [Flavobacterium sp. MFBS3-15]|uniref:T9SS type A sorting domain-containing protein n=1 Tax=Flavobacterium sp. MFBS3-15 TaxID=2989816 RepID=UPI0022362250|nr:T9SS type A sorting domain-containing protein [Flavobacterium sp. MFBS3-15]MCW4469685.1 T9SS type A sorting domain-containing protein [Flavobacterium sp. MFBS3-15]